MNFNLGSNFGQTLVQMVYEKLTESDLQGAINVLKEALIGINDEQVKLIITGKSTIETSDDGANINMVDYDENLHKGYLIWKPEKEFEWRFKRALNFECLRCLQKYLSLGKHTNSIETYSIKKIINLDPEFDTCANITFTSIELYHQVCKYKWIESTYINDEKSVKRYKELKDMANGEDYSQKLLTQTLCAIDEVRENVHDIIGLVEIAKYFDYEISGELKNKIRDYLITIKYDFNYIPLPEIFEKHIYPCYQKYDAGYIAPNGDIYGMNGETSSLLHLEIANKLANDIDLSKYSSGAINNTDYALDQAGWIKFHFDTFNKYSFRENHITDAQADTIARYATDFLDGIIGFEHDTVTVAKWKQMDNIMREEKFR